MSQPSNSTLPELHSTSSVQPEMTSPTDRSTSESPPRSEEECLIIAKRNQEQSPLLRLPGELRNRIYDYLHGHEWDVPRVHTGFFWFGHKEEKFDPSPAGLREALLSTQVCRQIYSESSLLPFVKGIFKVKDASWLLRLPPRQRDAVTTLDLKCGLIFKHMEASIIVSTVMFFPVTDKFPQMVRVKNISICVILYSHTNFSLSDISDGDVKNAMAEKIRGIRNISSDARITMAYAFEKIGPYIMVAM